MQFNCCKNSPWLWDLDTCQGTRKPHWNFWNTMFQKTYYMHTLLYSQNKGTCETSYQTKSHQKQTLTWNHKRRKTPVVWTCNKKVWHTYQHHPAGCCAWRRKKRETKDKLDHKHQRLDRLKIAWFYKNWKRRGRMEDSYCYIIGALMITVASGLTDWLTLLHTCPEIRTENEIGSCL